MSKANLVKYVASAILAALPRGDFHDPFGFLKNDASSDAKR